MMRATTKHTAMTCERAAPGSTTSTDVGFETKPLPLEDSDVPLMRFRNRGGMDEIRNTHVDLDVIDAGCDLAPHLLPHLLFGSHFADCTAKQSPWCVDQWACREHSGSLQVSLRHTVAQRETQQRRVALLPRLQSV